MDRAGGKEEEDEDDEGSASSRECVLQAFPALPLTQLPPASRQFPSCLISSPCSQRRPAGAGGQGQTKASLLTAPPRKGLFFSPSLFFSSPSPPSWAGATGSLALGLVGMEQQMAARRLAGPAAAPSRGADARPARGRINGSGAIRTAGLPAGFPPRQHTPIPAQGLPARWGLAAAKGCLGKPEDGMAKSHWKGTGELLLLSALAVVLRPLPLQRCSCPPPVPVQQGGHATLVPARLQQHPDCSGKLWLNPTSAAHPSPSEHGASRGIKG